MSVASHADDTSCEKDFFSVFILSLLHAQRFADRLLARPKIPRRSLAYNHNFRPGLRIFRRKTAPANDRDAEDLEPIRPDVEVRSAHRQPLRRLFAWHGDRQAASA